MTPALACMAAWTLGVATAAAFLPGRPSLGVAACLGAVLAGGAALLVRPAALGLAVAAALLGAARAELPAGDPAQPGLAATIAGSQAVLVGRVTDDPRPLGDGYEAMVEPSRLALAGGGRAPAGARLATSIGDVLVLGRGLSAPGQGDVVEATGRLDLPRDLPGFDRRANLAQRGAYLELRASRVVDLEALDPASAPAALPGWLRDRYRAAVFELLPQPHAQLLVGIVLGVRAGIPSRLQQDLVATGLVHLLVLSGLKVAVFTRVVTGALGPPLGRAAALPALALIVLYALAGGATPAAVRAAMMGGLALVAGHLGRPTHVWTSLAASAAVMLAWRPDLVRDVGFQLSFVGTCALVLLTPPLARRLRWLPDPLREPLAATCAAQVGTAPLTAASFHVLSPSAPLANTAVLPLLPAIVGAGLVMVPLAALPAVGRLAALPLAGLLAYVEQVADLLAHAPAAAFPAPPVSTATGAGYYLAVGGALAAARLEGRPRRAALLAAVLGPAIIGAAELAAWGRPDTSATVLSVGNGQSVLLAGPAGYVLVDGGASPSRLESALGARLPPWRRHLAALVITGPGRGHVGGLVGLDYRASAVVLPDGPLGGTEMRTAATAQVDRGARLVVAHAGQELRMGGLDIEVLSPEPGAPDPGQLALRVRGPHGPTFCDLADLPPDDQVLAAGRLRGGCNALLVPSGGASAPAPELMAAARPSRLIVSDGGGRIARDLPTAALSRTSEEGDIVLPL
jgi:competence protein ComEC